MSDAKPPRPVTQFRLTPAVAEQRIKKLATDTANIDWSLHALERMDQRGIYDVDVLRVLRTGVIDGAPEAARAQEWKCKMTREITGGREVGVVTIIMANNRLFIKTVEWEDLR